MAKSLDLFGSDVEENTFFASCQAALGNSPLELLILHCQDAALLILRQLATRTIYRLTTTSKCIFSFIWRRCMTTLSLRNCSNSFIKYLKRKPPLTEIQIRDDLKSHFLELFIDFKLTALRVLGNISDKGFRLLTNLQNISCLELHHPQNAVALAGCLSSLNNLTDLHLNATSPYNANLGLHKLTRLKTLSLQGSSCQLDILPLSLKELSVSICFPKDKTLDGLTHLQNLQLLSLQEVHFRYAAHTWLAFHRLTTLTVLSNLETLRLAALMDSDGVMSNVAGAPKLVNLYINGGTWEKNGNRWKAAT